MYLRIEALIFDLLFSFTVENATSTTETVPHKGEKRAREVDDGRVFLNKDAVHFKHVNTNFFKHHAFNFL